MTQVANTHHESLQSHDPRNCNETPFPLSAFDTKSFAYHTIQTRLPIILTRIVDHLSRYKSQVYGEKELEDAHHAHPGGPQEAWNVRRQEAEEDLKYVLGALAKLRNEMQTNKTMTPFPSSRSLTPASASADEFITDDLEEWNHAFTTKIAQNVVNPEDPPKWFEVSFLFAECYLYRRISLAIQETKHLKRLDPFKWQKAESLRDCTETIHSLLNNLSTIMAKALASDKSGPETFEDSFHQFLRLSLWGNKGDLSLSAGREPFKSDAYDSDTHNKMGEAILVDDSEQVWAHLLSCHQGRSREGHVRVDIICDNYGQELVTDLIFGEFLIASRLATQVCYHVKGLPWFVSDTTIADFLRMLDIIDDHSGKYGQKWRNYLMTGKFVLTTDPFWTMPYDFDYMQSRAPKLYSYLQQSSLIIVKGDLNYRKLTGDLKWSHTTPFRTALRSFHPAPLCALRGLKAEVVVGLVAGQAETVYREANDWLTSGHYNVVQFLNPSYR